MSKAPDFSHEEPKKPKVSFGDFLRTRRNELEKTQREVGSLQSGYVSQIETGTIARINPYALLEIAEVCEFSLSEVASSTDLDEDLIADARAILIGESALRLPLDDQRALIEKLGVEDRI